MMEQSRNESKRSNEFANHPRDQARFSRCKKMRGSGKQLRPRKTVDEFANIDHDECERTVTNETKSNTFSDPVSWMESTNIERKTTPVKIEKNRQDDFDSDPLSSQSSDLRSPSKLMMMRSKMKRVMKEKYRKDNLITNYFKKSPNKKVLSRSNTKWIEPDIDSKRKKFSPQKSGALNSDDEVDVKTSNQKSTISAQIETKISSSNSSFVPKRNNFEENEISESDEMNQSFESSSSAKNGKVQNSSFDTANDDHQTETEFDDLHDSLPKISLNLKSPASNNKKEFMAMIRDIEKYENVFSDMTDENQAILTQAANEPIETILTEQRNREYAQKLEANRCAESENMQRISEEYREIVGHIRRNSGDRARFKEMFKINRKLLQTIRSTYVEVDEEPISPQNVIHILRIVGERSLNENRLMFIPLALYYIALVNTKNDENESDDKPIEASYDWIRRNIERLLRFGCEIETVRIDLSFEILASVCCCIRLAISFSDSIIEYERNIACLQVILQIFFDQLSTRYAIFDRFDHRTLGLLLFAIFSAFRLLPSAPQQQPPQSEELNFVTIGHELFESLLRQILSNSHTEDEKNETYHHHSNRCNEAFSFFALLHYHYLLRKPIVFALNSWLDLTKSLPLVDDKHRFRAVTLYVALKQISNRKQINDDGEEEVEDEKIELPDSITFKTIIELLENDRNFLNCKKQNKQKQTEVENCNEISYLISILYFMTVPINSDRAESSEMHRVAQLLADGMQWERTSFRNKCRLISVQRLLESRSMLEFDPPMSDPNEKKTEKLKIAKSTYTKTTNLDK